MINDLDIVQWGYLLSPEFELINSAGKPLTGGYIEVYIHGTRNKYYCASDFNGTLHPFQIPLDSLGSNIVLASPAHAYDVYVYNKYGSLIMSRYNVLPQVQGTAVVSGEINITSNDNTVTITQVGDNNFDLSVADTVSSITDMVTDVVSAVSSNLMNEIIETAQEVSGLIPDVSNFTTHTEVNEAIVTAIDLVTSIIPTEQVQSDWNQNNPAEPDYIKNKPDLSNLVTENELATAITTVTGMIPSTSTFATHTEVYDSTVTAINLVTSIIPEAQVQSNWTETDTSDPSYIQNKPEEYTVIAGQNIGIFVDGNNFTIAASGTDLTNYATHTEVNNVSGQIISTMNDVSGTIVEMIPSAQVQSDWNQSDNTQPDYIKNKPNLSNFVTDQEFIEVVSGVTGVGDYGQFYSTAVSGGAIMFRTKGTIDVTNDGKIKLKKGNSYHVTVRGRYNASTLTNVYGDISYIEYITFNPIHINVDKTVSESQYFEISYDLYQLNSDSDYYVFFSGLDGTINDLYIEIHAIGHVGAGGTVTGSPEYDAGWGIQILNNVISVNPSIIPDDINLVAGNNIGITVSGSDLVISASGNDLSDYATLEQLQDSVELVTGLIPTVQLNESDQVTAINNYPIYSQGGGTQYSAGDGIDITNNVISVDNTVALKSDIPDVSNYVTENELVTAVTAVSGMIPPAQVQSNWTETNTSSKAYIQNKPLEYSVVAGQNIGIAVNGTNLVISAANPDLTSYATHSEVNTVSGAIVNLIPPAQVQSNWSETNTSSKAYIKNKPDLNVYATHTEVNNVSAAIMNEIPDVSDFVTESEVNTVSGILEGHIQTVSAAIPDVSNLATKDEVITQVQAATAMIPDVSDFATETEVNEATATAINYVTNLIPDISPLATKVELQDSIELVTGMIPPAQIQSDWSQSDNTQVDYIKNKPDLNVYATHTEVNNVSGTIVNLIPDVSNFATESEVIAQVQAATAMIPDVSDLATKDELQDGLELVTGMIPDISDLATKDELQDGLELVTGLIPAAQVQSDWTQSDNTQVDYIKNKPTETTLYAGDNINITVSGVSAVISSTGGGGGATYTAGDHIGIENNEISVTGITELVAGNAITITTSGASAIISSTGEAQVQSNWNETNPSSKAYIQNKPTIPAAQVQSNWNETNTSSKAYIQNKPTIHNYTGASGINITNDTITLDNPIGLVAGQNIAIEVSGVSAIISATGGGGGTQVQSDWTQTDNTQVDYIKNKPDEKTLVAGNNITITTSGASAIISSTGGGSSYSAGNMLSITNNTIDVTTTAGITDIQLVSALPASPVSSVLYLISEA